MAIEEIIEQLKSSGLYAECPCGCEFKLADATLFDGTKPFPSEAIKIQQGLEQGLQERLDDLKKKLKHATTHTKTTTKAINLGMHLEKILPTLKDFKWTIPDCRFLANPIDFIAFEGLSLNKIKGIDFVEVKSGNAKLNDHQKCIKEAIEDKKVSYKEFA